MTLTSLVVFVFVFGCSFPPNFSHWVAEKSSPVKNCTQHSQAFLSSIHMLPSLTGTPERPCFLSSIFRQYLRNTKLHRSWARRLPSTGIHLSFLLQPPSRVVQDLIRHIKLKLNWRLTKGILQWIKKDDKKQKDGNSSDRYGSNKCLLYSMHFLMPEITSELEKVLSFSWTWQMNEQAGIKRFSSLLKYLVLT